MKYQKVKQTRRVVRFYRVSFDFREPFRVFVDGSFLHSCIQKRLGVPKDLFAKLLGTDVKVFTSKCVQADLRQKGEEYAGTALAAQRLSCVRGGLQPPASGKDSIIELLGEDNPEHFFVATLDAELKREIRKVPGTPIVTLQNTSVVLEQPSAQQKKVAEKTERRTKRPTEMEQKWLKAQKQKRQADGSPSPSSAMDAATHTRNEMLFKKRPRSKAKGPNPLSVRKPKEDGKPRRKRKRDSAPVEQGTTPHATEHAPEPGTEHRRKRPRKRTRKRRSKEDGAGPAD